MDLLNGRLKLRHLVLVNAIAEQGSVLGAAEALHLAQPAATRSLRELESLLRVRLFDRRPRGVVPTVHGKVFVEHARSVLAELRRVGERFEELADGSSGSVTVGTLLAGSNVLLPRAILALKRERPGVVVTVHEAAAETQWPRLLDGELDLVVGRLAPTGLQGLRQIPLLSEPVRLVVRAGHPALRRELRGLADLMEYPWALPVPETALRRELDAAFHDAGLGMPREQVECSNGFTVLALVRHTDMIAAVPDLVAGADRSLAQLPLELERARQRVGVTLPDRPLTPCARLMLEHLRHQAVLIESAAGCDMPGHDGPEGCAAPVDTLHHPSLYG
ncbi:LysR substrate-binding domain-containing protein [Streptomyces cacaoi]|uniref:Galactose-binding protein n=1 Tax=Streptomyces cacaoi TaxID=1898 RepID=A0A4Y3QUX2_STRCI|nr:LysR substrate-binding domain-containing protein [Streptomyces cacaoi]NNG83453.1 LysR family transcriptional regulator [Streptomyces cacaoi]GEB49204.1 galactose-binding protein [Streptomyces cacaoi]